MVNINGWYMVNIWVWYVIIIIYLCIDSLIYIYICWLFQVVSSTFSVGMAALGHPKHFFGRKENSNRNMKTQTNDSFHQVHQTPIFYQFSGPACQELPCPSPPSSASSSGPRLGFSPSSARACAVRPGNIHRNTLWLCQSSYWKWP